jgi:transcriptional regulator with GAF, ATPase, and Fis domain
MATETPDLPDPREPASGEADTTVGDDLPQRLAALARTMQHQPTSVAVMDTIVSAVVREVPGAEEATISLVHGRRRVVSAAATSEVARQFDALQEQTRQGPCLDAMYEHQTVRVDDIRADPRWPELGRRVDELGLISMLCIQLLVHGDDLGAMNLLARRPHAFTDESEHVALLIASHAAVAVAQAQKLNHLGIALASRDIIGQAKGVLMERYKITAHEAFALLAKVSQDTNHRLHDVAEYLTLTGVLESGRGARDQPPPPEPQSDQ